MALVRIQDGMRRVVLWSAGLNKDQTLAAKVLAAAIAAGGSPYVMVLMVDVLAVLHDAA